MNDNGRKVIVVASGDSSVTRLLREIAADTGTNVVVDQPVPDNIVLKSRSLGLSTWIAERQLKTADANLPPETIYAHEPNAQGVILPIKTQMAARFPLLSRREQRAMQRQIGKQAEKERGE